MKNTLSQTLAAGRVAKNLGRLVGLSRPSYLTGLILATLLLAACGGGGSSSSGGGGGPQVYQVSSATVVGGFRNVTINWRNPAVGAGNVTAVNITYQIVAVNGQTNDKTTLLLSEPRHLLSDGATVITHTINPFEPARYTFTIEPVLGGALINATTRAVVFSNVNVIVNPDDLDSDGVLNSVDVDDDGDGLIELSTAAELNMMRNNLNGTGLDADNSDMVFDAGGDSTGCGAAIGDVCNGYEQMADIELNDLDTVYPGIANWEPTGRCNNGGGSTSCAIADQQYFSAKFNGNDYTINNMRIFVTVQATGIGFFGGTSAGSELRNMHIRNGSITTSSNFVLAVGGLVGIATGTRIISSSTTMARISVRTSVGGLVGLADGGITIVSSYAIVDELVTSSEVNSGLVGISGSLQGTNITSSVAIIGKASLSNAGGGLLGRGSHANINSSYVVVNSFMSSTRTGGLVGDEIANIRIDASYVVVNNSIVGNGGLVGSGVATAINSYWDATTLTPSATANSIGTGLPTTSLQSGTSTSAGTGDIFSEWDQVYCNPATGEFSDSAAAGFVLAWDLGTDTEYPALNCFSTFSPAQQRETAARALAGETLVE